VWNRKRPILNFVGLNPSTADENVDDPTIRRIIGFAVNWKYGGLNMLNIFALRSTDPLGLVANKEASLGPENDTYLKAIAGPCVVGWGNWGRLHGRSEDMRCILPETAQCFGLTKHWEPRHPLYLHHTAQLVSWRGALAERERVKEGDAGCPKPEGS
jgi:hypothetical protein